MDKFDNAIFLAAGMGTRLNPLTLSTPKPLIEVGGITMIENSIQLLIVAGIKHIIIVTGYLHEKFNFLKEKYASVEITLVYNDYYGDYNNAYSLALVSDYLKNSIILEADLIIKASLIEKLTPGGFFYYTYKIDRENNEWQIIVSKDGAITDIHQRGVGNYYVAGVSTIDEKSSNILRPYLKNVYTQQKKEEFWDQIVAEHLDELTVKIKEIDKDEIFEIDSIADFELYNAKQLAAAKHLTK